MSATLTNVAKPSQRRQLAGLRAFIRQMASIPQETQAHIARVKDAHALQVQFSGLPDEACADLGLSAEDILSAPSYSDDLPFFMQSGFGNRG
jgi:hypothetical protein